MVTVYFIPALGGFYRFEHARIIRKVPAHLLDVPFTDAQEESWGRDGYADTVTDNGIIRYMIDKES